MQVTIHIKSRQRRADLDETPNAISQDAVGVYTETDGGFTLAYEEPDPSMGGKVTLTYTAQGRKLMLERIQPAGRTVMIFTEGISTECVYRTPYGSLPLSIRTSKLSVLTLGRTFSITLRYRLESDNMDTMEIEFSLLAKQRRDQA